MNVIKSLILIVCLGLSAFGYSYQQTEYNKQMQEAINNDNVKIVRSLIESKNIDIEEFIEDLENCETPLLYASKLGKYDVVKYLIEAGANVNVFDDSDRTPLHLILKDDEMKEKQLLKICQMLIQAGSDVNCADFLGQTPLMIACKYQDKYAAVIEFIIASGAKVEARDDKGSTPLILASEYNNIVALKVLAKNNVDFGAVNNDGLNALLMAAREGEIRTVSYFIHELGININQKTRSGMTPLMSAIVGKQDEMIEYLVFQGADVNVKTILPITVLIRNPNLFIDFYPKKEVIAAGTTTLNIAKKYSSYAIVELLISAGAR